jgi:hypothetical protein
MRRFYAAKLRNSPLRNKPVTSLRQIAREIYTYTRTEARSHALLDVCSIDNCLRSPGRMSVSPTPRRPHAESLRPVAHWLQRTRKGRNVGPARGGAGPARFRDGPEAPGLALAPPPGRVALRASRRPALAPSGRAGPHGRAVGSGVGAGGVGSAPRPAPFKRRAPVRAAAPQRARVRSRRGARRIRDRRPIWSGRRGLPRARGKHAGGGRTRSARARSAP